MPVTGLTTDAGHFRGLLNGNEPSDETIARGVAWQAGFIMGVITVRIKPGHLLFLWFLTGSQHIKTICHPCLLP